MDSLQLLSCALPTDEKVWDDLPRYDFEEKGDDRRLSSRSASSSSSQQERRQSASPSSKATDSQESRHKASPSPFELYKNEFMTPPPNIPQCREMSPYRKNTAYSAKPTVVTPEQHIDFIRSVFDTIRIHESPKERNQLLQRNIQLPETKPTNRILLPVLGETFGGESTRHEISLPMRRDSNNLYGFDSANVNTGRDAHSGYTETRQMMSSAAGVLYEPRSSVKALAKCSDEWRLLQAAKLEIASVKEFLRQNSILNETKCQSGHPKRDNEEVSIGIETLLLSDDQVEVMEEDYLSSDRKMGTTRFRRQISFGEKPPRMPHSPHEFYRYRQSTGLNEKIAEF